MTTMQEDEQHALLDAVTAEAGACTPGCCRQHVYALLVKPNAKILQNNVSLQNSQASKSHKLLSPRANIVSVSIDMWRLWT